MGGVYTMSMFKHLSWKLMVIFSLMLFIGISAIGIYAAYHLETKMISAAQEKLRSDLTIAKAYVNSRIPGDWEYRDGKLFKGGSLMNNSSWVDEIKEMTGDHVTLFLQDTRVATSVLNKNGNRAVGTKASPEVIRRVLQESKTFLGKAQVVGIDNLAAYEPLLDASGQVIGMLFVGVPITPYEQMIYDFKKNLALFLIAEVLLAAMGIYYVSKRISKPIEQLATAASLVAKGNLAVEIDIDAKDEVGLLAAAFSQMTENLNQLITNMGLTAKQVAASSHQMSNASMSLSQGTNEQASTIQQLAASMQMIASQTQANAEYANKGTLLTESAKKNAGESKLHMGEMLTSMEMIQHSSLQISNIIKVIDEIAFQTNLLALNAAIEASRAGQHGKGFAVVAEEVRNLAARSAQAAKETAMLIETAVKRAADGTKTTMATADSLEHLAGNITQVSQLVDHIATACNEQALSISQINQGITQVSQVVQNNSAAAHETAAASQELNSQAALLKEMVSKFHVKES